MKTKIKNTTGTTREIELELPFYTKSILGVFRLRMVDGLIVGDGITSIDSKVYNYRAIPESIIIEKEIASEADWLSATVHLLKYLNINL